MMSKTITLLFFIAALSAVEAKKKKSNGAFQYSADGPYFTLPITVGSQRTKLHVGIDGFYGASLIYCPNAGSPAGGFSHKSSTTWKPAVANRKFNMSLGVAEGSSGSDYIQVGDLPPLDSDMFGNPETVTANALSKLPQASGFFAMWGPQDAADMKTTMQLVAEKAKKPKITFHAPKHLNGKHTITIGKEDRKNCGTNWIELPAIPSLYKDEQPWTVRMNGFQWGSYKKTKKIAVAFNVAADYFVAPKQHANYIYKKLKAKYSNQYHGGLVNCSKRSTAPALVFFVAGQRLTIPASQYIKKFNSNTCLLNIYPDDINWWTLPYQFHQKRCVKYDYGSKTVSISDQQ